MGGPGAMVLLFFLLFANGKDSAHYLMVEYKQNKKEKGM
ncbi:hypothetical protein EcB7A_3811 [Escherichia coli B7A]|nr:hypothetical protein EcB7A_3811 [Escherichia coli B7A]